MLEVLYDWLVIDPAYLVAALIVMALTCLPFAAGGSAGWLAYKLMKKHKPPSDPPAAEKAISGTHGSLLCGSLHRVHYWCRIHSTARLNIPMFEKGLKGEGRERTTIDGLERLSAVPLSAASVRFATSSVRCTDGERPLVAVA